MLIAPRRGSLAAQGRECRREGTVISPLSRLVEIHRAAGEMK